MGKINGNHHWVYVGLVGEPDALVVRVMRLFSAYAINKPH